MSILVFFIVYLFIWLRNVKLLRGKKLKVYGFLKGGKLSRWYLWKFVYLLIIGFVMFLKFEGDGNG